MQAVSPKPHLGGGEDAWKEVGKNTKKTNKTPTASPSTVQDGEKSNLNAFGVLGDQEGDDIEEDSSAEGKSEREEKEEVMVTSPKQKSQKRIVRIQYILTRHIWDRLVLVACIVPLH